MLELTSIKGIGPKIIEKLLKLNIKNIKDLILFYPFRYEILKRSTKEEFFQDNKVIIDGIIETNANSFRIKKNFDKMSFNLNVGFNVIKIVIFNRGFLKNNLKIGTKIYVIGKYDLKHNTILASDINFDQLTNNPKIIPIYHGVKGIGSKNIHSYINEIIDHITLTDYIPDYLKLKYGFMDKKTCMIEVHNPTNNEILSKARLRLKYEELFKFMLKINLLKNNQKEENSLKRILEKYELDKIINKLPFELTVDQITTVNDIYEDLIGLKRMNRLIQGDVGSGKTIVAIIAMYLNSMSGYQSCLMAPTEILAEQHYINTSKLLNQFNIKCGLLTGKIKSKDRRLLLEKIKNKEIDVIIGTHALFSDDVVYNNLGLVITDEQHRFGVNQRGSLKNKGIKPDILYMSATPIPRTYALTIYGDMDISSIKTMPNGRKPINTMIKSDSEIKEVLNMILKELKAGHQIYIVAPSIEETEEVSMENTEELKSKFSKAFKDYRIKSLHGKMKTDEKDLVMNKFKNKDIDILISTTVIEVGVDVQNATVMVIFDADRFGLSTLHQLRGRVGRNSLDSYCILISNKEKERLNVLVNTTDGFKISEEDFKLRGSGDLFGIKQSGDMVFDLADVKKDYKILLQAKKDSDEFFFKLKENNEYKKYLDIINDVNYLN